MKHSKYWLNQSSIRFLNFCPVAYSPLEGLEIWLNERIDLHDRLQNKLQIIMLLSTYKKQKNWLYFQFFEDYNENEKCKNEWSTRN